ncbi:MAG TPA: SAM-dependent methyltransferase [Dokdonella sp.]|nr:SAM-dependent methyltransferase [Dokdonella sp.]
MAESNPIRDVSDTARWVAIYRAMESERRDALFRDPYARRLGGERGEAIVDALPRGRSMSWPLVVRTAVMDEIVLRCAREGAATVLNLAAGLDTRPYRLDLPPTLRWIHVDMPAMVDCFREQMAAETPRCTLEFVAADLRDAAVRRELFTRVAACGPVLAISEGLLIYLDADDVAALSRDLHDVARARWWLFDLASPLLLKFLERRWSPTLRDAGAALRFGPSEGTAFFAPHGWHEQEFRSSWDESLRLGRSARGAWFLQLLSRLQSRRTRDAYRRMSGIVLLHTDRQRVTS